MFDAPHKEEALMRVGAEKKVLLVVEDARSILVVDVLAIGLDAPVKGLLSIVTVHKPAIAPIEVDLQPPLGIGHGPIALGAQMKLQKRLRVGALGKRSDREVLVANHLMLLSDTSLQEKLLIRQVSIALLQIRLVVSMCAGDDIHRSR